MAVVQEMPKKSQKQLMSNVVYLFLEIFNVYKFYGDYVSCIEAIWSKETNIRSSFGVFSSFEAFLSFDINPLKNFCMKLIMHHLLNYLNKNKILKILIFF